MQILLTAVNAKYIHSNPAIYCLSSYAAKYREQIGLAEYTINQSEDEVLRSIYEKHPKVLAISCYIWNIGMVQRLIREYRKLDHEVAIWVGGPEVSYDARSCIERLPELTGVMIGEGEETFLELAEHYIEKTRELSDIAGLVYRDKEGMVHQTAFRGPVEFRNLPFLYQDVLDLHTFENRIVYYETSRGCPFSCSYCLSSIDKRVRFRDLNLVYQELQLFLDKQVPQVKFIDRTFNCNKEHAMGILKYVKEHDNQITNFHFEIAADILDEEEIEFLSTLRPGLIQLEIGVQSTNLETIHAIHRHMDLDKVRNNVAKIKAGHNIHQHLDLIAGLPFEDYQRFGQSFDDVYAMQPDQLQLGFLKVLKGSLMEEMSNTYGIVFHGEAPYEVLYTKWLSYEDVCRLKDVEEMVEVYYNSGQFTYTIGYLRHYFPSAFSLYEALAGFYRLNGLFGLNQARIRRYYLLHGFAKKYGFSQGQMEVLEELMMFDLYLREKLKSRPEFARSGEIDKRKYKEFLTQQAEQYSIGDHVHIEHFTYQLLEAAQHGTLGKDDFYILFDYSKPKNFMGQCEYRILREKNGKLTVIEE